VPKTDLHNHGVAGADPASVEEILGRGFAPLDHRVQIEELVRNALANIAMSSVLTVTRTPASKI
jgi:hypothetical protein